MYFRTEDIARQMAEQRICEQQKLAEHQHIEQQARDYQVREQQAREQRLAEQQRLREQQRVEQQRLAEQQRREQQRAIQQKLADERLVAQRVSEQKLREECQLHKQLLREVSARTTEMVSRQLEPPRQLVLPAMTVGLQSGLNGSSCSEETIAGIGVQDCRKSEAGLLQGGITQAPDTVSPIVQQIKQVSAANQELLAELQQATSLQFGLGKYTPEYASAGAQMATQLSMDSAVLSSIASNSETLSAEDKQRVESVELPKYTRKKKTKPPIPTRSNAIFLPEE